jgi:CHAT domain-containing protein
MAHYELPPRAVIERAARQVYMLLTARNQAIDQQNELQRRSRLDRAAREYESAASALSQMILGPVAAQIGKQKRLLVVSEGALQYLPFAALPSPAGTLPQEGSAKRPLLLGHEVVNLPSASVMAALRRGQEGRKKAPKAVAVLADPVFARSDARVKAITERKTPNRGTTRGTDEENRTLATDTSAREVEEPLIRSLDDMGRLRGGGFNLSRLPFSRREAKTILSVTPAGQGMEALDFHASRTTATDSQLAEYRMIHFATHGLLDSEHPELSGLVFSLVNSQGEPQNGFLSLEDVYNLSLSAELVVLSACETGLGKEIQGEGLLSLTRGFMYAGAPTVVASLWSVDDEATAELMGRFYRAMQKEGMRPAGALRRAQMEIVHQKRWSEPYYWSGFVIQGEWR